MDADRASGGRDVDTGADAGGGAGGGGRDADTGADAGGGTSGGAGGDGALFVNHYTHSKAYIREYAAYFYFMKLPRIIINILLVLMAIIGALSLASGYRLLGERVLTILYVAVPLTIMAMNIYRFYKYTNLSFKQQLDLNNGAPFEARIEISGGHITLNNMSTGSVSKMGFEQFKPRIAMTKNLYILISTSKLHVMLRKDSFEKGSAAGFLQYMIGKGFK